VLFIIEFSTLVDAVVGPESQARVLRAFGRDALVQGGGFRLEEGLHEQADRENGALAKHTVHLHCAAHHLDHALADAQA
jgi:hypothetical protein